MVSGRPQNEATQREENSGSLPFLQFTDGGIRVNFGGYHAEAGLGGLLRGAGTGGLHASVGTPWGAHAGAGLGGQVGANDGTLGGGLYARAGLGRGRPEAAAGLGGRLDGRSTKPISGGMYAGATPGGGPGPGVFLGGGVGAAGGIDGFASGSATKETDVNPRATADAAAGAAASADGAASETKPKKGYTNIQIIPSREKNAQKKNEKVALEAAASVDTFADEKTKSQDKETRRAINAEVGLVKSAYIGAAPVVGVVKSVEKQVVVPAAAAPTQATIQANATINAVTIPENNQNVVVGTKTVYPPRWYFRKRFWAAPRKTVYVGPSAAIDTQSSPSDVVGELFASAVGNDGGAIDASKTYTGGGAITASKTYTSGSLFDDIFNIPISTLAAVNQLLKNNVG
ncbi:uncharacterized transmembrane protein DDB_G0289901 isoform X3 [Pseudomyrmex gracilis]|nr:uncharacterized transmembrane protein DDB_G0289901 isoform X3 [Pseudomyrmex gracilis]XP_020282130.1 uncharacterized transmembrane protein DDB_G0289901 isoform X3 [Pseudomyrmex gracilis]